MMQKESTVWVCRVPVGTIWTSPEKVREVDAHGTGQTVKINKWLESMNEEENHDLTKSKRVQTQLLYGEPVLVDKVEGDWAHVVAIWQPSGKDERGYPGWLPVAQLAEVEAVNEQGYARVIAGKAQLWTLDLKPLLAVPFNTMLPVKEAGEYFRVHTPDGDALIWQDDVELAADYDQVLAGSGRDIARLGTEFLDLQYFWGGMSSYGYDCSGFTYNMLKANGAIISRDANDQARDGQEVDKDVQDSWHIGDLLFFSNEEGGWEPHHVGIYFGNGMMIHSPTPGKAIEIIELAGTKHERELCAVRRFAQEE
ncbi:C40 family peptidase [Planomicrobium sp. CPCC 101079]|uniref:C40 family peptidase n=1 Tax=Planomicrobium sp. CPCC 101079 TaxID=2599618 RepID=UPI0011B63EA2|nr:C40 family peptidase [Planomicrobium sp. CPCC 101079]TWT03555.1 NlpC/P60 family protein [Planomicrobium sp. CPCC 101079]